MSRDTLKSEVNPHIARLETLQAQLSEVLRLSKLSRDTGNGSHGSVMDALIHLKDNADFPKSLHPVLNKLHKAFYLDAERNIEETIRIQREELDTRKPGAFASKRKKENVEIDNPEAMLRLVGNE